MDAARRVIATAAGVLGLVAAGPVWAVPDYVDAVPNLGETDCGVCHDTTFRDQFIDAGEQWTAELAGLDADGDGFSNGWELQDPSGLWLAGTADPGDPGFVSNPADAGDLPPVPVAFEPTTVQHAELPGADGSEPVVVRNVGGVAFDWTLETDVSWLLTDPASGTGLAPGVGDSVDLLFSTAVLAEGQYEGSASIVISGIAPERLPALPVTLVLPEAGATPAGVGATVALLALARRRAGRAGASSRRRLVR